MKKILVLIVSILIAQSSFAQDQKYMETLQEILNDTGVRCKVWRWSNEGFGEQTTVEFNRFDKPKKSTRLSNSNRVAWVSGETKSIEFTDQRSLPNAVLQLEYRVSASGANYDELEKGMYIKVQCSTESPLCGYEQKIIQAGNFSWRLGWDQTLHVKCSDLSYYAKCKEFLNQ